MSERSSAATEGPGGHEARPLVDDRAVPWRVFLAVGAFVLVVGAIYWGTAYEESGTVMLIVAGLLSLWISAYLWLRARTPSIEEDAVAAERPGEVVHYLPHASVWPFAIGLGAATLGNGLVLGMWLIVPGGLLMVLGIVGFVRQTRRRD